MIDLALHLPLFYKLGLPHRDIKMQYNNLASLKKISRLTLGGGGLGQVWGETNSEEAIATVKAAIDAGINLIDTAPMYFKCEEVIKACFAGSLPTGIRITSKCQLGEPPAGKTKEILQASVEASLKAMQLEHIDVFLLHSNICEDDSVFAFNNEHRARFATPWSIYADEVVPAMDALKQQGHIGAWGITGVGIPETILKALQHDKKPDVVQAVSNLLDSAGGMRRYAQPPQPRQIIKQAQTHSVGVMGIRAVQAGALTKLIDRSISDNHPDSADYKRAAPFRALCAELGVDPALLAHRYALDMSGVDTVVLGVKNRAELNQCLEAEAMAALPDELRHRINDLGLKGPA